MFGNLNKIKNKTLNIQQKPILLFEGCVNSRSGYGNHSRILLRSLLKMDKFEIVVFPTRWGNTPMTALDANKPEDKAILDLFRQNLDREPDLHIQVTIPSEFRKLGKRFLGISAGTEASIAPLNFCQGANNADLIIVPSNFTKEVLLGTKYDKKNEQGQIVETIQVNKPVSVLFEGLDTNIFQKNNINKSDLTAELNSIPEKWCFLSVGHWLQGRIYEDRKDVSGLIHTFLKTFLKKKERPGLILKTSGAGFSITERDQIIEKINQIQEMVREETGHKGTMPSIHLINGDLTDDQMNELYSHPKVKSMVSFTKGEGFGLPLLEFASTGKPIIASAYSGQLDFLHPDHSFLLPGKLTQIDGSAANEWLPKEGQWFSVNYQYAGQVMKDCFENYDKYLEKSRKSSKYVKDNFSIEKMTESFLEILEKNFNFVENNSETPKLQIKLPQLKKLT